MNLKFKATLETMKRAGLVPDPLLDFDLLARLHAAGEDITNPAPMPDEAALLAPAIRVGNVVLHRLTIGARWFLADCVAKWFTQDNDPGWTASLLFVCAHARQPELLWACTTREAMLREATAWVRGVGATDDEIEAALAQILGVGKPAYPNAVKPRKPIEGAMLEQVTAEHGIAPEDALWRHQEAEIALLATGFAERKSREAGSLSDPDSPRIRRLISYQKAEAALREQIEKRRIAK